MRYKLVTYFCLSWILIVMIFVAGSCSPNVTTGKIDEAEVKMEVNDNPGEALPILQSICFDSIQSDADKARYGYLYARAIHKLNQQMDTDLFIKQAVDYYRSKGDSPELMKSLFYYSTYLFENGLSVAAMRTLMKSRQLAIKYKDDYWRAKDAELMADVLNVNHNNHEAIKFSLESAEHYSKSGREDNARYAYVDLAINYGNIFNYNRSFELIDSIKNIAEHENDSVLLAYCYRNEYIFRIKVRENSKALDTLVKLQSLNKKIGFTYEDHAYRAWLYAENGMIDSAEVILHCLTNLYLDDRIKSLVYCTYENINKRKDDIVSAVRYADSIISLNDRDYRNASSQLLIAAQRDYLDEDLKIAEIKTAKQRYLLIAMAVVAVVVILGIILFYQYRLKVRRLENQKKVNDIIMAFNSERCKNAILEQTINNQKGTLTQMSNQLSINLQNVDGLRNDIQNLYKKQWSLLNELCYEYFEKKDSDKLRLYIFKRIEEELDNFRNEIKMDEIVKSIDRYMDGLAGKFMTQCDFLNESDRRFVLLVFAGFSSRAICLFMGFKKKNYYARKNKIISKIAESDIPDRALFIGYLK